MCLKNIMLSEWSETQKVTYFMILFKWNMQNTWVHRDKIEVLWLPEAREQQEGRATLNVTGFTLGVIMFWSSIDLVVASHCESINCHCIVPLKTFNFMLRKFYLDKKYQNCLIFWKVKKKPHRLFVCFTICNYIRQMKQECLFYLQAFK